MSEKTERVEIWVKDPPRKIYDGKMRIGEHGMPCVRVTQPKSPNGYYDYPVWIFPANWLLLLPKDIPAGTLLGAWRKLESIVNEVRAWEKEGNDDI